MLLFKRVKDLQDYINTEKSKGKSVGFAPTMGALHKGHMSLLQKAIEENDCSVCSIFVNPTQFNEASDLTKYPRIPGKDIDLLAAVGCDILFMPPVEEVYPDGQKNDLSFDFGYIAKPMEGANRPGHFEGVAQVVHRLLEIVQPDRLYMGQKDFQQFAICQRMIQLAKLPIEIVMCPIIREEDGLAMSSRNVRLTEENRKIATEIHKTLLKAKKQARMKFPQEIEEEAMNYLKSIPNFKPEYFEIVEGRTLQQFEVFEDVNYAVACTAVWAGDVRLIDNMILKSVE